MVEKLFVYGTLQEAEVQQAVLGRIAELREDILHDFKKGDVEINGTIYPIAIPAVGSQIVGKVLEASPEEIAMMDEYETAAYQRIMIVLESGDDSWVYCQP